MDFLSGIWNAAKGIWGWFTGGSTLASIAQTALTAFGVSQLSKFTNKENATTAASTTTAPDPGVRLQVDPDTEHKIPVVYGEAHLGAIVTDAQLTNDNKTMVYCLTICERTGVKLSDSQQSTVTFQDAYWNDQRIVFKADGITTDYSVDRDGNVDYSIQDRVKIYFYSGGSASSNQQAPDGFSITATNAWTVMPGWSSSYTMNELVFAIIRVDYNKDKGITGLPTMAFHVKNNMDMPGDCIYDYMTNTRYGAGIDPTEIYSS